MRRRTRHFPLFQTPDDQRTLIDWGRLLPLSGYLANDARQEDEYADRHLATSGFWVRNVWTHWPERQRSVLDDDHGRHGKDRRLSVQENERIRHQARRKGIRFNPS
jgi:hypothetical protein